MKTCSICKSRDIKMEVGAYEYRALPGITLHGVRHFECQSCGAVQTAIPAMGMLNRILASRVINKTEPLTGPEIRFLRTYVGLSAKDLAGVLGVAAASVSRWENGFRPMTAATERLLRVLVAHVRKLDFEALDLLPSIDDVVSDPAPVRFESDGTDWHEAA